MAIQGADLLMALLEGVSKPGSSELGNWDSHPGSSLGFYV